MKKLRRHEKKLDKMSRKSNYVIATMMMRNNGKYVDLTNSTDFGACVEQTKRDFFQLAEWSVTVKTRGKCSSASVRSTVPIQCKVWYVSCARVPRDLIFPVPFTMYINHLENAQHIGTSEWKCVAITYEHHPFILFYLRSVNCRKRTPADSLQHIARVCSVSIGLSLAHTHHEQRSPNFSHSVSNAKLYSRRTMKTKTKFSYTRTRCA